jgi:hypothetical protein
MKKKTIIKIESILLLTLVISTTVPANTIDEKEKKGSIEKDPIALIIDNRIDIDPNIYLSKPLLPLLKKAIRYVNNFPSKQLIQEIIRIINTKGLVNNEDINNIIKISNIYGLRSIRSGRIFINGGRTMTFPGVIAERSFLRTFIGAALIGLWIDGYDYDWNPCGSGYVIGFLGSCGVTPYVENNYYYLYGFGCLIIEY